MTEGKHIASRSFGSKATFYNWRKKFARRLPCYGANSPFTNMLKVDTPVRFDGVSDDDIKV